MEEYNYVLDVRAQNFRLRRSQTIAVVFPYVGESHRMISDPFYMEVIGGITDELHNYDYDLIVARVASDDEEWCLRYIMNKRVDGIIIVDRSLEDKGINKLRELGANFVVWGPTLENQGYVSVGGNSIKGAAMAVRHMAGLGRRRIGFIGGHQDMVETYLRRIGYGQGLDEAHLPLDESLVEYTDFSPQAGQRAIINLLDRAPDMDGVLICSDFMSIGAMQVISARGLRVPGDISVVGYDDIQLASHCNPRLTTIRQEMHEGGRLLVRKLFDIMEGIPAEPEMLPITLIVRDSCGGRSLLRA